MTLKLWLASASFVVPALLGFAPPAWAQEAARLYPEPVSYDPAIPTLQQVVGHAPGNRVTSHAEMERYVQALAAASPRAELFEYARSYEGRPLYYLVVAAEQNMARLEEIKVGIRRLADPREVQAADVDGLVDSLPVITWLSYTVHGNEISGTDAGLLLAYHLLAARDNELVETVFAESIVVIDPLQNPDGRDRFVHHFRETTGRWPNAHPLAVELNEPWPGGRTNHYLFDLNRDWFALTQPESVGKVAAYREWCPQVFIDLHEMGANSTYYFPPQADPRNPHQSEKIWEWLEVLGRNNARWFDRMRFDYFCREVFDSYYPGYGASWPMYQGAVGATYEQASARGLVRRRNDDTELHYRDTVHRHFIASISTVEMAARNRKGLLRHFFEHHREAMLDGAKSRQREVVLVPGRDPGRTARLVGRLIDQGLEVRRARQSFEASVHDYYGGPWGPRVLPEGSYLIDMAQPRMRLAMTLLSPRVEMDEEFLQKQLRRHEQRQGDQIYDVTAWSLPLMSGVEAWIAGSALGVEADRISSPPQLEGRVTGGESQVAYLVAWGTDDAARALAAMHREDIRVHSADRSFAIGGREYPAGSLIIKRRGNPDNLHERLQAIAAEHPVDIHPTDTSWVEDGINFGSNQVRYLPTPIVALAWDRPTNSSSAGSARYILERKFGVAVTAVNTRQLATADLSEFNVIVLPSSRGATSYGSTLGESGLKSLRDWTSAGGTLITIGGATGWAASEKAGLLATERVLLRHAKLDEEAEKNQGLSGQPESSFPRSWLPDEENPAGIPGALLRAELHSEHWAAFGYAAASGEIAMIDVLVNSSTFFRPLTIDQGTNVAVFLDTENILASGIAWDAERELVANTSFLMVQNHGSGHVVAFTEDPNYRAYLENLHLLFINAVMFGPAH